MYGNSRFASLKFKCGMVRNNNLHILVLFAQQISVNYYQFNTDYHDVI